MILQKKKLLEGIMAKQNFTGFCSTCMVNVCYLFFISQIVFGSHGVLKGITNGKCYVEMSTIDEDTIQDIAEVTGVLSLYYNPLHQDNMSMCLIPPYTPLLYMPRDRVGKVAEFQRS